MKKVATNYLTQMVGKALSLLAGLVIIALLTRYLSEDDWSAYITATSFLSFFGVFVDFGLTLTLTQMISSPHADEKKITGNVLGLRLVSGLIFYSLSLIVVIFLPYTEMAKMAVAAGSAAFFFLSAATSLIGLFQKHLAMRRYVVAELTSRGFYFVFTILCVFFKLGLVPVLLAMGAANGFWLLFVIMAAKPLISLRPQINWTIWKEALYRSSPIAISTIFNLVYLRGDVLILAWAKPGEVGQYGTAYKVVDILTAFPTMFMGLLLPQLTAAWEENKIVFKNLLQKAFDVFAVVIIPLFFGSQIVAEALTVLIASQKYLIAGSVLKILMIAIVCVFISTLYGHTIVALHKQKVMTWGYAFTAAVSIIGYLLVIPKFGMWGAAWVTCLSEFLIAFLTFLVVSKISQTVPSLNNAIKAVFSSIIMYLVLKILPAWPVLIIVVIGGLIYLITMIAVGGLKISELKNFIKPPSSFEKTS